ncbi:pyridoxamine 5'-phosphate oxidase family protein [Paenibacillus spiritus]|uniref:Pyridoxamine 5'-phosphate oxidase family protein n=1 Tax=Paenibacillus spiritus TaxID=2496557 RepID=A0A5J5FUD6_9BACL|nr:MULTISPECIES: pyridoxamine 5'-phosphate oxidase family protein [Paenibacillus]KAA8997155.1 pyridoxamine 5'-phosphate oxidase family protein [Paenibacillus spiritus]
MNQPNDWNAEAIDKVKELIKGMDTAMLTTISDKGPVSRPMKTQEVEFDGDIWFLTKKDTSKYQEILGNRNVNVVYAGKSYVSVRGTAEIVEDAAKKKEFWNPVYEKMLETSYDDPNVVLIKVHAAAAEYWDTGSMVKSAISLVRKITGSSKDTHLNETVELDGRQP